MTEVEAIIALTDMVQSGVETVALLAGMVIAIILAAVWKG